jgi:hypothetical protein
MHAVVTHALPPHPVLRHHYSMQHLIDPGVSTRRAADKCLHRPDRHGLRFAARQRPWRDVAGVPSRTAVPRVASALTVHSVTTVAVASWPAMTVAVQVRSRVRHFVVGAGDTEAAAGRQFHSDVIVWASQGHHRQAPVRIIVLWSASRTIGFPLQTTLRDMRRGMMLDAERVGWRPLRHRLGAPVVGCKTRDRSQDDA